MKEYKTIKEINEKILKLELKISKLREIKQSLCKHTYMSGGGFKMVCKECGYTKVTPYFY